MPSMMEEMTGVTEANIPVDKLSITSLARTPVTRLGTPVPI